MSETETDATETLTTQSTDESIAGWKRDSRLRRVLDARREDAGEKDKQEA